MNHRERVLAALSHQPPDRVPIDLGSTPVTGISAIAYDRLKQYLGLDLRPTRIYDRASQLAVVDEPLLERFGVDTRGIKPGLLDNRPLIEAPDEDAFIDEWGILRKRPPDANTYFIANSPLAGEISLHDILNYPWPPIDDPGRTRGLRERALELRAHGDWAIVLHLASSFIQHTQILRGFSDWYIDAAADPERLGALIDQVMEIQMGICGNILDQVGDVIDVVFNYDDLAMQDRLIVSPVMYRKLLEPRLRRFIEFLKYKTKAKIVHHTDGAVVPILDSLADMGIDAINPVQVSAAGMGDTSKLKQRFGKRLAFWGAIDTQHVLPFGSPADVRAETLQRIQDLNQDGGYILCSAHNIQSDVPPENIVSIYESAFGKQLV